MKLSRLRSSKDVLKKDLGDPEFRAEWERTALARARRQLLQRGSG